MGRPDEASRIALSDSEATLRQVEGVLDEFSSHEGGPDVARVIDELESQPSGLQDLVRLLIGTYTEIMGVIQSLRQSRGLLEQAAMERLKTTHEKLAEVSSATELAAAGMLDGLDRALGLVDELDDGARPADERSASADLLRDELHQLINLLQFQDITSQQLGYASAVLLDIEERMMRLVRVFDLQKVGVESLTEALVEHGRTRSGARPAEVCDPDASTMDAEARQALADEIFTAS